MSVRSYIKHALLCSAAIALSAVMLSSCASKMSDDEAQAIVAELLPRATEITEIVWGDGLPLEDETVSALESVVFAQYYPVAADSGYSSIDDIKAAAAEVFSSDYLDDVYAVAFGEYEVETKSAVETVGTPSAEVDEEPIITGSISEDDLDALTGRYSMIKDRLCIDIAYSSFDYDTVIDADTVRVVKRGDGVVRCEAECVSGGKKSVITITLREENGRWLLDGPVY